MRFKIKEITKATPAEKISLGSSLDKTFSIIKVSAKVEKTNAISPVSSSINSPSLLLYNDKENGAIKRYSNALKSSNYFHLYFT